MPRNNGNVEIRSQEVQEILGQMPSWIIRRGIALIFVVIALVVVGSYFFKYPDIITSRLVMTTKNPPAELMAKVDGKIEYLRVKENQRVEKGSVLAILENPARIEDVDSLATKLRSIQLFFTDFKLPTHAVFSKNYRLGEIQSSYATFLKHYSDYSNFLEQDYYGQKIALKNDQVKKYNMYYERLYRQRNILEKKLDISRHQFCRDSILYKKGVFALADYQKAQKSLLEQSYMFHGARTNLANTKISISVLTQEIMDLQMKRENELQTMQNRLIEDHDNLMAQIDIWEQNYVLRTPISGSVTFNKYWSSNQNVKRGDRVLTVIPRDSTCIVARLEVGISGAGKVKVGQRVNIKLDNYPYMEYGMLQGYIKSISLIPQEQKYSCDVALSNDLTTNYGQVLDFSQRMEGNAEIITEDIGLLQRVFYPIRALFSEHL